MTKDKQDEDPIGDRDEDKTNIVLVNNHPQDEEKEITQNLVVNSHNNRNTETMDGELELFQSILGVESETDKPPAITRKQPQITQYLNGTLDGNRGSPP